MNLNNSQPHNLVSTFSGPDHHSASGDQILLIQRKNEPFKNHWALPGGFLDPDDIDVKACASRELEEETNLIFHSHEFKMIGVYSKKNHFLSSRLQRCLKTFNRIDRFL